jgi:hypothetical protein
MIVELTREEADLVYASMRANAVLCLQGVPDFATHAKYDAIATRVHFARELAEHKLRAEKNGGVTWP